MFYLHHLAEGVLKIEPEAALFKRFRLEDQTAAQYDQGDQYRTWEHKVLRWDRTLGRKRSGVRVKIPSVKEELVCMFL